MEARPGMGSRADQVGGGGMTFYAVLAIFSAITAGVSVSLGSYGVAAFQGLLCVWVCAYMICLEIRHTSDRKPE